MRKGDEMIARSHRRKEKKKKGERERKRRDPVGVGRQIRCLLIGSTFLPHQGLSFLCLSFFKLMFQIWKYLHAIIRQLEVLTHLKKKTKQSQEACVSA